MSENNDDKRVLLVLTSHSDLGGVRPTGFYVDEAAHPWQVFRRKGFTVDLASIAGGVPPQDGRHLGDPVQEQFLHDADVSRQLANTPALAQIDANQYDAVLFVGGHGVMWDFPNNSAVNAVGRNIWERGGIVAAVCHGPAALVDMTLSDGSYLIAGRQVTGFTNGEEQAVGLTKVVPFSLADRLEARGAHHHAAPNFTENVVVDGRLVTGQNPQSATGVANAMVNLLTK